MSRRPISSKRTPLVQILILVVGVLVIAMAVVVLIVFAQGDGGDDDSDTPATATPADFGAAPVFTEHVLSVGPEHGTRVPQSTTRSVDPTQPSGVCATINFEGLPEDSANLWFRMAYDGVEVTPETVIAPQAGFICYAPEDGLEVGRHTAAVVLQDPTVADSEPTEVVAWEFEVIPD